MSTSPLLRNGSRLSEMVSVHVDVLRRDAEAGGDDLAHLDVEALGRVGARLLEADAWLVDLHADGDRRRRRPARPSCVPSANVGVFGDVDIRCVAA